MDDVAKLRTTRSPGQGGKDDFKIKGAATCGQHDVRGDASREDCTICLQSITERAVAVPCNHLAFDFICLVSWLQQRETCPLCNALITEVQYDWQSPQDYKTFRVDRPKTAGYGRSLRPANPVGSFFSTSSQSRLATRSNARAGTAPPQPENAALKRRRRVYRRRMYSSHVGINRASGYRDFTPTDFAQSATLQRRARMFLRRELQIFDHLNTDQLGRNKEFLLEYVVAVLKKLDPKGADGQAEDFLAEFLQRENARLLLHDLHAWLRSPHARLEDWDDEVQYAEDYDGSRGKDD